jgi:hypothetical protein
VPMAVLRLPKRKTLRDKHRISSSKIHRIPMEAMRAQPNGSIRPTRMDPKVNESHHPMMVCSSRPARKV